MEERSAFDLIDAHVGKSAVILGTGPSLRFINDRIRQHVTIAINAAVRKVLNPDYFLCSDGFVRNTTAWDAAVAATCPAVLRSYEHLPSDKNIGIAPDRAFWFGVRARAVSQAIDPQNDHPSKEFVHGLDAAQFGFNLAIIMGCSPIYMIGCDCGFEGEKGHFWDFDDDPLPYFKPESEWVLRLEGQKRSTYGLLGNCDFARQWWRTIIAANPDVDVRDASRAGLCGIVPQVELRELLK